MVRDRTMLPAVWLVLCVLCAGCNSDIAPPEEASKAPEPAPQPAPHAATTAEPAPAPVVEAASSAPTTVEKGDPESKVYEVFGKPKSKLAGQGRTILMYDMGRIELVDNKVVFNSMFSPAAPPVTRPPVAMTTPAPSASKTPPAAKKPDGSEKKSEEKTEKKAEAKAEKQGWLSGLFSKKVKGAKDGKPVETFADLAGPRYSSDEMWRWKVLMGNTFPQPTPEGWQGTVRLEGVEAEFKTAGGQMFMDKDCRARVEGDMLVIEYLGYEKEATFSHVKLFKIIDNKTLVCTDPNIFPGVLRAH